MNPFLTVALISLVGTLGAVCVMELIRVLVVGKRAEEFEANSPEEQTITSTEAIASPELAEAFESPSQLPARRFQLVLLDSFSGRASLGTPNLNEWFKIRRGVPLQIHLLPCVPQVVRDQIMTSDQWKPVDYRREDPGRLEFKEMNPALYFLHGHSTETEQTASLAELAGGVSLLGASATRRQ